MNLQPSHFKIIVQKQIEGTFREYTSIGVQVVFAIGECFLVLAAYYIPYWRWLVLFGFGIPISLLNLGIFLIEESPKFLHGQSTDKAVEVLNKIAKVNGKEPLRLNILQSVFKETDSNSYSVIDLFRYKSLRLKNICCAIVFVSIQMVYYGITFAISSVGLNIYVNSLIIGICELVGYALAGLLIVRLKRKLTTIIGVGTVSLMSLSFIFLSIPDSCAGSSICSQKIIQIVLAGLMRFGICVAWTVVYIWIAELFPAAVRNLALGFSSSVGTVGSAASPFVKSICSSMSISPMLPLGIVGLCGVVCCFPLLETRGAKLTDKIEELNDEDGEEQILVVEAEDDLSHIKDD